MLYLQNTMTYFSLEPGELGCTDLAKHEIKVTDDDPFKERFQRIPHQWWNKVCAHVKEMLEVDAQFTQVRAHGVNAVVLVHKKDGGLHFMHWLL